MLIIQLVVAKEENKWANEVAQIQLCAPRSPPRPPTSIHGPALYGIARNRCLTLWDSGARLKSVAFAPFWNVLPRKGTSDVTYCDVGSIRTASIHKCNFQNAILLQRCSSIPRISASAQR